MEYLPTLWLVMLFLATFFGRSFSADQPPQPSPDGPSSVCVLDFSPYPYKPTGECVGSREKVTEWGSVPTLLCCRNALATLSQALARHAQNSSLGNDNIFLQQPQWKDCSGPFYRQPSVSVSSCQFDDLYYGSSKCSGFSLSSLSNTFSDVGQKYETATKLCSDFEYSFDDVCGNCSNAVMALKDGLLNYSRVSDNSTETSICGVAAVISVAATKLGNVSWTDDFYRCLLTLDNTTSGYIKIKYSTAKLIFVMVVATIGVLMIVLLIKYVTRSKLKPPKPVRPEEFTSSSGFYIFSKAEIDNAINFSPERKYLGRGSAGQVYKGVLPSGQAVAIKHINKANKSDSFAREVAGFSRVRHPNLVCLFGYCVEGGEQYLVYEYCPEGNLSQHLLRKDTLLTWEMRVKILMHCATALRYLHYSVEGCIVHRDIKLTNILLTEKLDAKLSDFGLAKMLGMEQSKVFTDVRGTIGYMDPEYISNAKLSCASDIYSFGIVALQLLSGQKVIELDLDARDQLTRKAKDVTMGKRPLSDFEDPRLKGNINRTDFECILRVAVLCIAKSSKDRPRIDTVFEEIERVWKNTDPDMKAKEETNSAAASESASRSFDVLPV